MEEGTTPEAASLPKPAVMQANEAKTGQEARREAVVREAEAEVEAEVDLDTVVATREIVDPVNLKRPHRYPNKIQRQHNHHRSPEEMASLVLA